MIRNIERQVETINCLGFREVARRAVTLSDACAANSYDSTRYVWQIVSDSPEAALDYWFRSYQEDPEEAVYEVIEALHWVGKTASDIARIMS